MNKVDLSGADWRKSSRSSGNGQCVEVAFVGEWTAVRDSKNITAGVIAVMPREWRSLLAALK